MLRTLVFLAGVAWAATTASLNGVSLVTTSGGPVVWAPAGNVRGSTSNEVTGVTGNCANPAFLVQIGSVHTVVVSGTTKYERLVQIGTGPTTPSGSTSCTVYKAGAPLGWVTAGHTGPISGE